MAAIGFLNWAYGLATGDVAPPVERSGSGEAINTINKFADDLNKNSKDAWIQVGKSLMNLDDTANLKNGDSAFTTQFRDDMRQMFTSKEFTLDQQMNEGKNAAYLFARLYGADLRKYGKEGVFNLSGDHESWGIEKNIDEIASKYAYAANTESLVQDITFVKSDFIDPYTYFDHPENVPHTEKLTQESTEYQNVVRKENMVGRIMDYLKNNPDKYNIATISKAFQDEDNFMNEVYKKWNDSNITKSILEGDAGGTFKNLIGDGVTVVENGIVTVGDATIGSDISPIKPLWDLFKDLWSNAGTYLEIAAIVGVVFALAWLAGEIKYIAR